MTCSDVQVNSLELNFLLTTQTRTRDLPEVAFNFMHLQFILPHLHITPRPVAAEIQIRVFYDSLCISSTAGWHVVDATTLRTCLGSPNPVKFSEARFTDLVTVDADEDAIPWYQEADWALKQGS